MADHPAPSDQGELPPHVLKHPAFGNAPVANIRAPGRKKGTVSLRAERYKRWLASLPPTDPTPSFVDPLPPREAGKYFYPKRMLVQAYFCRSRNGEWSSPCMSLSMLADPRFVSPIGSLLNQLEDEGHNVQGARAEWQAFHEIGKALRQDALALTDQAVRLSYRRMPISATLAIDEIADESPK